MHTSDHSLSDEALIQLLRQDDKEVFSIIYNRYWDKLLVYVMRAVKVQLEAEDIVQELFISLWKRRNELTINTSLSSYLFTSARYMSVRHIERNISRNTYQELLLHFMDESYFNEPAPEKAFNNKEMGLQLEAAIAQLPGKMQQVFRLSREYNLSYHEIATRLNISEETVRKQIHRALKLLRIHLKDLSVCVFVSIIFR
ncbi:RNA polymerase sigma-70 factor [Chitinophaga sp. Cy-1792]|uniref:RNA polymerase sigma-70 factor n=1 Tax=Chitinophaga sp. Cy-1792 TaxID=2608339 RepID=UPI001423BB38|nr:RNA polymerase sigma-70 factor [Chitinophaga sp. Cy-1792]NIG52525.1 RNA polymerase sigma-70 factor [Chitinophaga sp. Cy-1792]